MPTFLCHGFRWSRDAIRIYVALNNMPDAAPEWLFGPRTADAILKNLYDENDFLPCCKQYSSKRHADLSAGYKEEEQAANYSAPGLHHQDWSAVKFLEEYDPEDETKASADFAYVADYVKQIRTSADLAEELIEYENRLNIAWMTDAAQRAPKAGDKTADPAPPRPAMRLAFPGDSDETSRQKEKREIASGHGHGWLERLRGSLEPNAQIKWYVVVTGDIDRTYPSSSGALGGSHGDSAQISAAVQVDESELATQGITSTQQSLRSIESQRELARAQLRAEFGGDDASEESGAARDIEQGEAQEETPWPHLAPVDGQNASSYAESSKHPSNVWTTPKDQAEDNRKEKSKANGLKKLFRRRKSSRGDERGLPG